MRRPLRYLAVAVLATALLVGAGLAVGGIGGDGGAARPPTVAPFTTTPLSAYDATGVAIRRASFCGRIDPRLVRATLGGPPSSSRSWGDGDRTVLAAGLTDVAHEYGCEYVGAAGSDGAAGRTARAWVFAPPVGRDRARIWAREADPVDGATCTSTPATLGSPSGLLTCRTATGQSATYRGLFGDAWLSCELDAPLSTPAATVQDLAGRWCVGVARSATAP